MRFMDLVGTIFPTFKVGKAKFDASALSDQRIHTLPDASGTVLLDSSLVSQSLSVPAGIVATIPAGKQHIVHRKFKVDGTLKLDGELIIL